MYRSKRQHPLHSFKFWFLVLSCVAATTAWRMGWLPSNHPETVSDLNDKEVDLSLPDAPRWDGSSPFGTDEKEIARRQQKFDQIYQQKPATEEKAFQEKVSSSSASLASTGPSRSSAAEIAEPGQAMQPTPFGIAHPEFVPADTFASQSKKESGHSSRQDQKSSGVRQAGGPVPEDGTARIVVQTAFDDPNWPPKPKTFDWSEIDRMIEAGEDVEAHRQLSTLYWQNPELGRPLMKRINQTARRIYFQPQPHYLPPYVVQPGDMLQDIAKDLQVPWQYLAKLNRTDPRRIAPGDKLKVIQGPFDAVVDLGQFRLTVTAHGYYVAQFPIGIGKDGSTPIGELQVLDKLEDPTYYGPDAVIANDDPSNPLGEYWLSLGNGYGIHGTIDESSIGRAASRGCIRLRNQDVADLYNLLTVGSKVLIRR